MKRVRRYVAIARRQRESKRISQVIGFPIAGFVAITSAELGLLSARDELTLSTAVPVVWLTLCFAGMIAVFMTWLQR
jgi:hypothetical protein